MNTCRNEKYMPNYILKNLKGIDYLEYLQIDKRIKLKCTGMGREDVNEVDVSQATIWWQTSVNTGIRRLLFESKHYLNVPSTNQLHKKDASQVQVA